MASMLSSATTASSIGLRICAYLFFRWIPGHHFPPIAYTLFAIYVPSFIATLLRQSPWKVVSEETDLIVDEAEVSVDPPTHASTAAHSSNLPPKKKPTSKVVAVEAIGTTVLRKRDPHALKSLLTGHPSPTSNVLSLISFLTNLLLVTGIVDQIYRGPTYHGNQDLSFARTGYVSHNAAKILVREPDVSRQPVYVSYREAVATAPIVESWKKAGSVGSLTNETDFTGSYLIRRLSSNTRYEWSTSNNQSGFFTTAPVPGRRNPPALTFLSTSCIKANFPYNPMSHPLSIPGLKHLANLLPELKAKFMLFLGDFIYIDVPQRLGSDVETYRKEYRMVYGSPDWPAVTKELPWIHVIDDHEIANDWDGNTTDPYPAAADPFNHYHVAVNPPELRKGKGYFTFVHGPASFFMLETRKYRSAEFPEALESPNKTMLGAQQLSDLLAWLKSDEGDSVRWKIVISSCPFTKNWRFGTEDTWGGYLHERRKILEGMWDVTLRLPGKSVVVLSGDRHEFGATKFPPPVGGRWPVDATVTEFSVSPLSQFYLPKETYKQTDGEDVMIKYVPTGQSKFGAIEIRNPEFGDQSQLTYRLFVDGKEKWRYLLTTPTGDENGLWS